MAKCNSSGTYAATKLERKAWILMLPHSNGGVIGVYQVKIVISSLIRYDDIAKLFKIFGLHNNTMYA